MPDEREDLEDRLNIEEEEVSEPSLLSRVLKGVIALALLVGFVYLSGLYQFFFYQRTPSTAEQQPVESAVDAEKLVLPLVVYVVRGEGDNGSARTLSDIEALVANASEVWKQANIELVVKDVVEVEKKEDEIFQFLDNTREFVSSVPGFDRSLINVFLIARLRGVNGIAFGGLNTVAVADYTTVYDFRALAHEVGHILGLEHVDNPQRLMHQGANGFELSLAEILDAREQAARFVSP